MRANLAYRTIKQVVGLSILLLVLIFVFCGCSSNNNKYELSSGLYIIGDRTDFYELAGVLYIRDEDVIISGKANRNVMITLDEIDSVTFENLNQAEYQIHVDTTGKTTSSTIHFVGTNAICTVSGSHEIVLSGGDKESVDITACVQAIENIVIKDLSLVTSSINSYGSLYITGEVNLDIKETIHESYEGNCFYSRIEAIDDIIIDLNKNGKISVSKYYDHDPIYSEGTIELKNNTVVTQPNGAYVKNLNGESYFVDKNDNTINEVIISAF